jgi:phage terminase small subunit
MGWQDQVKLTPKQERFVFEYLIDLNATQAAIRAGYSSDTAGVIGCENLGKPNVQEALRLAKEERAKKLEITPERVLAEFAKIGFADIKDFATFKTAKTVVGRDEKTGEPIIDYAHIVDIKDSDQVDGSVISEIALKDGQLKFKLYDKQKALEMVAKHLNMFTENVVHTGPGGGAIQTKHTIDLESLSVEELKVLANISAKGAGREPATT